MYSIEQVKTSAAACRYELIRPFNKRNSSITIGARFNFNGRRISQFIPCSSLKTSNPPQTFYPFVIMSMVEFYVVKNPFLFVYVLIIWIWWVLYASELKNVIIITHTYYMLEKKSHFDEEILFYSSLFSTGIHFSTSFIRPIDWRIFLFYFYHQCNNCV
jgi:hypothetical protein